jgi:glycosyltransferase involved in cell wall biosynthesis
MPFKPLDHPHPSGDLVIGGGIYQYLRQRGHDIHPISRLRLRWFYWKPWLWIRLGAEMVCVRRLLRQLRPHLWLTYHSYYKAPDVLGAVCAPDQGIPYAVFQGVYATKYRRKAKTRPGFHLNRYALLQADAVFTNKRRDEINLRRLLPENRLHYIPPGIRLERFPPEPAPSIALPRAWGAERLPVVLTAAMFRPGVKTDGLARVIICCGQLAAQGLRFRLVVCGDGEGASDLKQLAQGHLGDDVHFAGRVPQDQMRHYYRGADLFAFPGIREGLGMVFLEAQAAGLPVVACNGWGASEIVQHEQTGLLSPPGEWEKFERNIIRLLTDRSLSKKMGACARQHIARHHDLERNYGLLETHLVEVAARHAAALGDQQRA